MSNFYIKAGDEVIKCTFLYEASPNTCQAIEELMPIEGELHCAKIAGDEVFFAVPLKMPLEAGGIDVMTLGPGTIAYWADRSMLCFFHKAPQKEEANVAVVGRVVENLDGLGRIAEQVRRKQGMKVTVTSSP